ncbi:MAG: glutathione transferase GstA [bacterium]
MKLYYTPGACSLSPHIVMCEAGLSFQLEKTDLKAKKTETGKDYWAVNPKGSVPALEVREGEVLTEGPAIVQYLADQKPESRLAPPVGTLERYRLQEMLNFISTELHKQYSPLFYPDTHETQKKKALETLAKRYEFLSGILKDRPYLLGDAFTVADAYLFTVTNWARFLNFDLSPWPVIQQYQARIAERPAVQRAMKEEGLL